MSAEDLLLRRTKLALHVPDGGLERLESVARGASARDGARSVSRYVLAIDQGTTSSRSILFDHAGTGVAIAQREFTQHFPRPGWVEHDAEEIWRTQSATITEVLDRAGATSDDLAAIGIANQRETTVLWDRRTGSPVAPRDRLAGSPHRALCASLRAEGLEPEIVRRTGLLLDPYFSGTKLAWLLEQSPEFRARASRGELAFGTIDSWLIWKLTAGRHHLTDVTNASRTMLLNIHSGAMGRRSARAPAHSASSCCRRSCRRCSRIGVSLRSSMDAMSVSPVLPATSRPRSSGRAVSTPGMAKNTYGTGCFLLMNTGAVAVESRHRPAHDDRLGSR